jgi:hypothetical protein
MAYTKGEREKIQEEIIKRLSGGESLLKILKKKGMPRRNTIFDWLSKDEVFSNKYVRAIEAKADIIFDEIMEIADNADEKNYTRQNKQKLQIDTRKWVLSKMLPKKYGKLINFDVKNETKLTGIDIEIIRNEKKD